MSFRISYNISEKDIRKLELIAQTDGYLQVLRMNPDWASILEKRARLVEAVSSIGIEGTVLTMDQAKAITIGDETMPVGEKEKREFVGYYESLEFIRDKVDEKLNINLLLKIHEKITTGDADANPGKVRNDIRRIKSKGKIVYTAPPPEHLDVLLREFIDWFNNAVEDRSLSPVTVAAICHFWFVWIHPFCDGNGRTGRLLTTFLLLKKKSEGTRYFALSDYYNRNKDSYYDALEETNKCNSSSPSIAFHEDMSKWVTYFIDSYQDQMRGIKEVTNRILQLHIRVDHLRKTGKITENHEKILSFLSSREKASYKELADFLHVSRPRINQILEPLRKANILVQEPIGNLIWFKLGSPENEPDETVLKKPVKKRLNSTLTKKKKDSNEAVKYQQVLPIFEQDS